MKCTLPIHQLVYDTVPDARDEYLQNTCKKISVILLNISIRLLWKYRDEFLRRPTYTDVEKLNAYHEGEYVLDLVNLSCIYAIWNK